MHQQHTRLFGRLENSRDAQRLAGIHLKAFGELTPGREFLLREGEGCSTEETAELLDLRIETVKTRLHRARRLLQEHLRERAEAALDSTFPFLGWRCGRLTETVLLRLAGRFASDR